MVDFKKFVECISTNHYIDINNFDVISYPYNNMQMKCIGENNYDDFSFYNWE